MKKYLYVFRERVELICDMHAFTKLSSVSKHVFIYVYNLIYKKLTKIWYGKGRKSMIDSGKKRHEMLSANDLLMVAQEDPENRDETLDFVQDENEITVDEKIDGMCDEILDMKR